MLEEQITRIEKVKVFSLSTSKITIGNYPHRIINGNYPLISFSIRLILQI